MSWKISPSTYRPACAPFTPSNSGQRSDPTYYRGCWHVVSRSLFAGYGQVPPKREHSSPAKEVYILTDFILHAASLRQPFGHCAIFLTAASRRSLDRVSVPVWLVILSDQLTIVGLVSHYLTNYLIVRRPLPKRINPLIRRSYAALDSISGAYSSLWGMFPRVTQPSAARHHFSLQHQP